MRVQRRIRREKLSYLEGELVLRKMDNLACLITDKSRFRTSLSYQVSIHDTNLDGPREES